MHIWSRSAGIALGVALDAVFADPRRGHPVALFGRAAAALEKRLYGDARPNGVAHVALCVGAAAGVGMLAERVRHPLARTALTAAATWAVLGGTTLAREGAHMAGALEDKDVERARRRLPHLCGRDPSGLEEPELARATVESLAENTSDAVVAPLFWGAVAGIPGLLAYRAINTLDAMIGHRSPRYERFGWAAARLDDVANYVPARVTGLITVAVGPDRAGALAVLKKDGHRHPSPNAGQCESAFAGALGVTLGGTNVYGGRTEHRPTMGDGRAPEVGDIRRAVRLTRAVSFTAAALAVLAAMRPWPRRGPSWRPARTRPARPA
ncbi:cobalamin biosynthesis protein [Nonomuraea endophytica]|uniref:Cobalamin biosynthesis protein CobD n=1 Tax=Nonomuraea endophytica TaxID=714136 RepID=A0A7W7ZYS2_9ACTN|nr:cobalamin biosynthesis protein [Nonomuraea endophytica]MBB5076303.1 adenosylcobinamide-phosphate synthase [Nonomuraea endophytica]